MRTLAHARVLGYESIPSGGSKQVAGEAGMHVQVVTYRLTDGVSDDEFVAANQEFAEMMAAVPGLLAKVWLKNEGESVYGGLYLWQDRDAFDNFMSGELWAAVLTDDSVSDLVSRDFAVMDGLTRSTQPLLEMV